MKGLEWSAQLVIYAREAQWVTEPHVPRIWERVETPRNE